MFFELIQMIGIIIPVIGLAAIIRNREQNDSSVRLALADAGCLMMNLAYFLMITSAGEEQAETALMAEAAGNSVFYFFFIMFGLSYLRIDIGHKFMLCWGVIEFLYVTVFCIDPLRNMLIGEYSYSVSPVFGVLTAVLETRPAYMIRCTLLCAILCAGLAYTSSKMFMTKIDSEKRSLAMLAGAQFVTAASFIIELVINPPFDIVPLFASLSILAIIRRLMKGKFFGITDSGRQWVFAQMDNAYIITDSLYGYLDANESAKKIFPELINHKISERIPDFLYEKFVSADDEFISAGRYYSKKVTEIMNDGSLAGYGILIQDITERYEKDAFLKDYNIKLEHDIQEKTSHIQLVQDSIITGMASVVESRDNSTGGHINRTSTVVRIFSGKLLDNPPIMQKLGIDAKFLENVGKAAPLHDLGKIAVDDVVLRKPGRFTDEEYAQMKKHPGEGAKVLKKVLVEVDDLDFVNVAVNVAHYHHERYDGKGYPNGISGETIPLEARIMALADVFDALVSKRCYKEAYGYDKAFSIIEEGLGTQFDPFLGKLFIECRPELEAYYDLL